MQASKGCLCSVELLDLLRGTECLTMPLGSSPAAAQGPGDVLAGDQELIQTIGLTGHE